jgi:hypothetical protein
MTSLKEEASQMLLFLKNIENIEIKRWNAGADQPEIIFKSMVMNISLELRNKRSFVGVSISSGELSTAVRIADYTLRISCESGDKSFINADTYEENWEVCNQLGGLNSSKMAKNPANALLRLVPWGGLAACLSTGRDDTKNKSKHGLRSGLAYCFLPLPVLTGLPVMVNGFFELSSNRRDIWQGGGPGAEMTGDGRIRAEWNLSLMKDVIAPSYVRLLLKARGILGFNEVYQSLWPTSPSVSAPWSVIVENTLLGCRDEKLLYVGQKEPITSDGRIKDEGITGLLNLSLKALSGMTNDSCSNSWVVCNQAVLLPDFTEDSQGRALAMLTIEEENMLGEFLLNSEQPFVQCSSALRKALSKSKIITKIAFPNLVRNILKSSHDELEKGVHMYTPSAAMCSSFLLRYCLCDLNPAVSTDCKKLDMLPILPLGGTQDSVGVVRVFSKNEASAAKEVSSIGFSISQVLLVIIMLLL